MPDLLPELERPVLARLRRRLDLEVRGPGPRSSQRQRAGLSLLALDAYYDGQQRLQQLGLALPDDLRDFVTIVAWPGTYVDAIAERQRVEGFRLAGQPKADEGLWEIWQANDLDTESTLARIDSLALRRGYYCVGTRENDDPLGDIPLITVESPLEMIHEWSSRERRTAAAARFYTDDSTGRQRRHATLYLPDSTSHVVSTSAGWEVVSRDEHGLGRTPVVPLVNGQRTHNRYGVSQMDRVIGLTDAAARGLTITQFATEVLGAPQRWAANVSQADFKDPKTGEMLTAWETYLGRIWATASKDAKFGQFDAANLQNFSGIVSHYAQLTSGVTGLPMRYLGQMSDNPPSADGIRADESRLVNTCEAKNTGEDGVLEEVMTLAELIRNPGADVARLKQMETLHRNPATPTLAQAADAAVKLRAEGIISLRQARRDLGYTAVQISNMEDDDAEEAAADPLVRAARGLQDPTGDAA